MKDKTTIDNPRRRAICLLLATFLGCLPASAQSVEFSTLHGFVYTNGINPDASLILSGGVLYGTTQSGGESGFNSGYGSVFKLNTDGSGFSDVRVFTDGPDGYNLECSLVLAGSTVFGTALFGGGSNYGTIFGIDTSGAGLTNLYNFPVTANDFPYTNGPGAYPEAGLVLDGNTLYGVTSYGGIYGWGTLFSLNTNGAGFNNLHNFDASDGQYPSSPLLLSGGTLYGSTAPGGANEVGTIFKVNTNGAGFTNLYSFSWQGGYPYTNSDGATPRGALILSGNSLYGTASSGGSNACGTIFQIDTDGANFTTLYMFGGLAGEAQTNNDGANPKSGLLLYDNALYGAAQNGGHFGNGTVFRLNLDGSGFTTLYHFTATNNAAGTNADGAHPFGGLIQSGGVLYGTANAGGTGGYGTVYSIVVPPTLNITHSGSNVTLSWPTNPVGFVLNQTSSLSSPITWTPVTSGITISGANYTITMDASSGRKFYRLIGP